MLPGLATPEGTARYRERFPQLRDAGYFRRPEHVPGAGERWLSSIGLGTYLGEPDEATDTAYTEAILAALRSGINVLDTAINYRHQRSERNIGAALAQLIAAGELKRDEVLVCTKAGYLSFDGGIPADPRGYFQREYVVPGILDPKELAGGMHCMAPAYLENQIERSRRNLGLESIDLFYLHNPETQLADVPPDLFRKRLKGAFTLLEKQVKAGKLSFYGLATWNGFRVPQDSRGYISLVEAEDVAREAGGEHHHLRFIQLPFNLAMPEAFSLPNQHLEKKNLPVLVVAERLGIAVMGSATLQQGQLAHGLPEAIGKILGRPTNAENAIQFSRSTPGLTTSLVGMSRKEHVAANLNGAFGPLTTREEWARLFTPR
jgi:aryl-alcohol dehydrogenase-like predicted oxidoreductase